MTDWERHGAVTGVEVAEVAPAEVQVDEILALLDRVADADGVEALGEQPVRSLRARSTAVTHLVARSDCRPVGYGQVDGHGEGATAELAVDPATRRRGVGTALLRAVFDREPGAAVWAHGDLAPARGLASRLGLVRTRELLRMERDPATGPEVAAPVAPDELEFGSLDEAVSEGGGRWPGLDARADLLRVNNAAFAWHPEQGGWSREQLDKRLAVEWVDPAGIFLAVDPDEPRLLGFHWTKREALPDGRTGGEVYVVGVDPAAQGRRIGSLLTRLGVAHLEASGVAVVDLYVEGDNHPARRTYENLGFRVAHSDVTYSTENSSP